MNHIDASDLRYWNYYKIIVEDLENCSRYIEFSEDNMRTYSVELARILISAASEIDVIMKLICKQYGMKSSNIHDYFSCISQRESDLIKEIAGIPRYDIALYPFSEWNENESPLWWKAYNHVKHQRDEFFEEANVSNAINAVCALLLVNLYYLKIKYSETIHNIVKKLPTASEFVRVKNDYYPIVLGI